MSQVAGAADDPRPLMPPEPEPGACCQNGCDPCVYDRYWDAMNRYEEALAAWERRHPDAPAVPSPGPDIGQ